MWPAVGTTPRGQLRYSCLALVSSDFSCMLLGTGTHRRSIPVPSMGGHLMSSVSVLCLFSSLGADAVGDMLASRFPLLAPLHAPWMCSCLSSIRCWSVWSCGDGASAARAWLGRIPVLAQAPGSARSAYSPLKGVVAALLHPLGHAPLGSIHVSWSVGALPVSVVCSPLLRVTCLDQAIVGFQLW